MSLKSEIEARSKQIRTDSYQMSIGELSNLYRDKELDVHPEFQRIYRWSDAQKTRLIESLLLGIPLPPIFVAQRDDGVWDVIDGVQRISTILQFMGLLVDEEGKQVRPLILLESRYLPSLKGKVWEDRKDKASSFSKEEQLYIKRAKIDIKIMLEESDKDAQYELFIRLNTGRAPLSAQEVRNCLMVMAHPQTYRWLKDLSEDQNFLEAVGLSDRTLEEKYNMELGFRFIVFRMMNEAELSKVSDISEHLNDKISWLASLSRTQREIEEKAFRDTFKFIATNLGSNGFRRYDSRKHDFSGGFSIPAFESVALGIGYHHSSREGIQVGDGLLAAVKSLWSHHEFADNSGPGVRDSTRIPKIVPLGRVLFKP
jgi:uncharacterized protein with ParB-like and HNH nuclease domain